MRPLLATPRAAVCGVLVFVVLVFARAVAFGIDVRDRANFGIGGVSAAWNELSSLLTALVPLAVVAAVVAFVAIRSPRISRQALLGVAFLVIANAGTSCAKIFASAVLPVGRGTLPSGHTTLAVTAAGVVVLLTPGAWRQIGLPVSGFLGALGPLGVIAALWHTPCDPAAAIALMPMWLWISAYVTQYLLGQRSPSGPAALVSRRLPPPRHLAPEADLSTSLLLGGGAATLPVMLMGWGFRPEHFSVQDYLLGVSEFVFLPLAATAVLVDVARVGEELGTPKH